MCSGEEGRACWHWQRWSRFGLTHRQMWTWKRDVEEEHSPSDGDQGCDQELSPAVATTRPVALAMGQELPRAGTSPGSHSGHGAFHTLFSAAFLLNINCDYYRTAHPCHTAPEAVQTWDRMKLSLLKSLQQQDLPLSKGEGAASRYK